MLITSDNNTAVLTHSGTASGGNMDCAKQSYNNIITYRNDTVPVQTLDITGTTDTKSVRKEQILKNMLKKR